MILNADIIRTTKASNLWNSFTLGEQSILNASFYDLVSTNTSTITIKMDGFSDESWPNVPLFLICKGYKIEEYAKSIKVFL